MLEHMALNVSDPKAVAAWYSEHMGMRIVRRVDNAPFIHFLADEKGSLIEIYSNPAGEIPAYEKLSPYTLHLAFASEDIERDSQRLIAAGATSSTPKELTPAGDQLLFMRDPWGMSIQLVKRAKALV